MTIKSNFPSIRPSLNLDFANTRALDPRITFTRTTTATYYDGKTTAKAEENLLLQSQDFSTTWSAGSTTVTANTEVAPNGTTTAETITATASTAIHRVTQTGAGASGTLRTVSVFAKAGTNNYLQIYFDGDAQAFGNFDIDTGVVGTNGTSATISIVNFGNDWYRCILTTSSATSGTTLNIILTSSDSAARAESWTTAGTETVFLWGAQLEQRSAVTDYTPTTTAPITNYVPALQTAASGVARFDHRPLTGESLGLLVEEQRTNLLTYSAEFNDAAWTKVQSSITANTVVAPDGTLTGDKLVEDTTNNRHQVTRGVGAFIDRATQRTISVYVKAAGRTQLQIQDNAFSSNVARAIFDLSSGTVTLSTVTGTATIQGTSITPVGNGWFRCSLTCIPQSTSGAGSTISFETSVSGNPTYTGDGFSGIFIWGAQLEAAAFPTSYIPTVAATVTRNADAASMTGANFSSWYNQAEGTVYCDHQLYTASASNRAAYDINDNSTNNRIVYRAATTGVTDQVVIRNAGTTYAQLASVGPYTTSATKNSTGYKVNDFALVRNAATPVTDTSGLVPAGCTQLLIGSAQGNIEYLSGYIRKLAFYPSRLPDAQLQALTAS
jgi:hypothetical protein